MTQKIRYARPGDRLTARYVNRLVDGANLALKVLTPPRSTRLPANDSFNPELDANGNGSLDGLTTRVYQEVSRVSSTVRVFSEQDESCYVDVARIDQVTLRAENEQITLTFNNP